MWDLLDEANAYGYLKRIGCSDIQFVKTGTGKTPDLSAWRQGQLVLCEVKAINITQREAERRERIHSGESMACTTPMTVPDRVLRKIRSTVVSAIEQLDAVDPARQSERFVFTVLHFDDWVGDFQDRYIKQLDRYLLANPVEGAQLVFYIARELFGRRFRMKSATVCKN